MMTCWVANPRKIGRPLMTWGSTVNKAARYFDIDMEFDEWRCLPELAPEEWCKLIEPWKWESTGENDDDLIPLV